MSKAQFYLILFAAYSYLDELVRGLKTASDSGNDDVLAHYYSALADLSAAIDAFHSDYQDLI